MSGWSSSDVEGRHFDAHDAAESARALTKNNTELGASLEAALKRIDDARFEVVRIINMLTRRASQLEDSGDLAESAALSDAVHAIEHLQHLGQDGDPFVAVETDQ